MLVKVEQKDIDEGVEFNCTKCPLARAIKRTLKTRKRVGVGIGSVSVGTRPIKFYALPEEAITFRRQFDSGCPVTPISFKLNMRAHRVMK